MSFTFVSGHVALDLTGTVGHRRTDATDLLAGPEDLSRWLADAGVLGSRAAIGDDEFDLGLRLRESIYRLACAARDGHPFDRTDRGLVNSVAAGSPVRLRIAEDGTLDRVGDGAAGLSTVARAAIELVTGSSAGLIRECLGAECTRLYVDGSARGSRRWCDMRRCGNRAKVASFRSRAARH